MTAIRYSVGLGTFTVQKAEDETPRLAFDSRATDGAFENYGYTAQARFDQRGGSARVLESGHVTIFKGGQS